MRSDRVDQGDDEPKVQLEVEVEIGVRGLETVKQPIIHETLTLFIYTRYQDDIHFFDIIHHHTTYCKVSIITPGEAKRSKIAK